MSINSQRLNSATQLLNLITFAEKNNLLLSKHSYFIKLVHVLIKTIFLIKQRTAESFDRVQLFSLIKYSSTKKIKELLFDQKKSTHLVLSISQSDKTWLIKEVLYNFKCAYLELKNLESNVYSYIDNLIMLLANISLASEEVSAICEDVSEMILKGKNTVNIYININRFIGLQYKSFKTVVPRKSMGKLIKTILNKLIYGSNGHDKLGIQNYSANIFNNFYSDDGIFDDDTLIDELLLNIDEVNGFDKYQNFIFLLTLYNICTTNCKDKLKGYILKMPEGITDKVYNLTSKIILINMKLTNIINNNIIEKDIEDMSKILSENLNSGQLDSKVFELGNQMRYFIKNHADYPQITLTQEIVDKINQIEEKYNNMNKMMSSF